MTKSIESDLRLIKLFFEIDVAGPGEVCDQFETQIPSAFQGCHDRLLLSIVKTWVNQSPSDREVWAVDDMFLLVWPGEYDVVMSFAKGEELRALAHEVGLSTIAKTNAEVLAYIEPIRARNKAAAEGKSSRTTRFDLPGFGQVTLVPVVFDNPGELSGLDKESLGDPFMSDFPCELFMGRRRRTR